MNRQQAERLLQIAIGNSHARFRAGQWEAIDAVSNRRAKLLLVQRTGWGKSAVYFVATRIFPRRRSRPNHHRIAAARLDAKSG